MTPLIGGLIEAGLRVLDKVLPDPQAKAAAQLELIRLQQAGEFKELEADIQRSQMQADVNKVEAANSDPFTSRWRPFIGWVCGSALAYQFILAPILTWAAAMLAHPEIIAPALNTGDLLTILLGMLGLGGLRTAEKIKGVA